MNYKGNFIVIDGIDGCGKTSQTKELHSYLAGKNIDTVLTKEPGGTKAGAVFRNVLLSREYDIEPVSELLLYCADRLEHQKKTVIPAVESGKTVICDRFIMSTYAYQVFGRQLDKDILDFITEKTVTRFPDLSIIIDVDIDIAVMRAKNRLEKNSQVHDEGKFEMLPREFFKRVRDGFLWYEKKFPNTVRIDGNRPFMDIKNEITDLVIKLEGVV